MWKIWGKNKQTNLLCLSPKFSNEIKLQKDLVEDKRPPIILGKHQYIYIYIKIYIILLLFQFLLFLLKRCPDFALLPSPISSTALLKGCEAGLVNQTEDGGWIIPAHYLSVLPLSGSADVADGLWQTSAPPAPPQREPSPPIIRCNRW